MELVPSVDFWVRDEFLQARKRQMSAERLRDQAAGRHDVIYIGTDENVLCDFCNKEVTDVMITLVEFGKRVACDSCYHRDYALKELKYRRLKDDGTLGEYVKKP